MSERIGLFADLHSNLEAFEACMAKAEELGVTRMVFLGDIVGYNADPAVLIERIADLVSSKKAIAVVGNHDEAVFKDYRLQMNASANAAIEWTKTQLQDNHVQFLKELPLIIKEEKICFVHASAHNPSDWNYVTDSMSAWRCVQNSGKSYTFVGHAHEQALFYQSAVGKLIRFAPHPGDEIPVLQHRQWVGVVGSLGQPRDGNPEACFAVFEPDSEALTFHRVPYDWFTAAEKVRRAGLPEDLANRLITGR
ncbi:metallophosphoesterase family protein [Polynucleobacter sp. 15G-AUS-farblos]|uniref:metallophosphoesterase family protein n=1 Tax=Polynucleobacter sp. 15G-AUS-farblos TaxID=2689094 RepID=UPI001C0AF9A2|nr:metallophosphoesterase family protein [Polynucleobacter sp. 15G-AUS-farblos]MBU3583683.1 metallophosphoesterase family protein [Polynucleobacter sp. 15G-AUS-farblos]